VNLTDAVDEVVTHLSDDQVSSLAGVCADRQQAPHGLPGMAAGASPSARAAIAQLLAAWAASPALTGPGTALSLEVGRRGRRREADLRPSAVWTGPGAALTERLTSGVLHELIAGACRRIVIVSFAAHTLPGVAVDLEAAIARGCAVDAVFETADDSAGKYLGPAKPFAAIDGIRRWHWPAARRPDGALLHAKLLAVDDRRALVGSANLTSRALTSNLEVGAVLRDAATVRALVAHVDALIGSGDLELSP
jgi:putative cardiolipin synthase